MPALEIALSTPTDILQPCLPQYPSAKWKQGRTFWSHFLCMFWWATTFFVPFWSAAATCVIEFQQGWNFGAVPLSAKVRAESQTKVQLIRATGDKLADDLAEKSTKIRIKLAKKQMHIAFWGSIEFGKIQRVVTSGHKCLAQLDPQNIGHINFPDKFAIDWSLMIRVQMN